MNLYEIEELIKLAVEDGITIDEDTGEVAGLNDESLNKLECAKETKIENIGLYIKNMDAFAKSIIIEQMVLDRRKKQCKAKADFLKKYLSGFLLGNKLNKFETAKLKLSFRKSAVVETIEDFNNKDYLKVKTTTEIDKVKIKTDIKNGIEIDGAVIKEKQNLQIK